MLIFEEKWPNYASGPKSAQHSFWVRQLFNVCVRVFHAPNLTISSVYRAAKIKISFIWKDDFFCQNRQIFYKSIAGRLPSIVQVYTQPYSFGGRIKLIIYQIRHELSVTIHETSTSWRKKKTLDGGPYKKKNKKNFKRNLYKYYKIKIELLLWLNSVWCCFFLWFLKGFLLDCVGRLKSIMLKSLRFSTHDM